MGQRDKPSINTCKSFGSREENAAVWEEYDAQLLALADVPTVEIGTTVSRLVPLTSAILRKLPRVFRDQILQKAYEQFVGRVPASLPFCYGVTFEANHPTLMAYVSGSLKSDFEGYHRDHRRSERVQNLAFGFYDSIAKKPDPKNPSEDMEKLKDMILVVEFMTGGRYSDPTLQAGDAFEGYDDGLLAWKEKAEAHNCSLTPAYDLLAMYAMVEGLEQEELSTEHAPALTQKLEEAFGPS